MLTLNFDFTFQDLNSLSGFQKLDKFFLKYLKEQDYALHEQLKLYRINGSKNISRKEHSEFLLKIAPFLDDFIAELFNIEDKNSLLKQEHVKFDIIYECRRKFIQRYVIKKYPKESLDSFNFPQISNELKGLIESITEQSISVAVLNWQTDPGKYQNEIDVVAKYCAFMVHNYSSLTLFDIPRSIEHVRPYRIKDLEKNLRLGFDYRDTEKTMDKALAHAKYCIYCHKQEKDSCSRGIVDSDKTGCPLEQKISEMHNIKSQGFNIAALSIIMIDNPLVAATGHRICNDCMKSCIYQKQDPVNTPLVEANILEEVLSLPWGVEIYILLSKWNPINIDSPIPKKQTGNNVLVAGLGPAGFALSHYLLNDGHNIYAIDGLKISGLNFDIKQPIKFWSDIKLPLSEKKPQGFGGVAEYGITNRWDKNNLILIRLLLERRKNFAMQGGVRLGSNITTKQAFNMGIDHIALCIGAGKPRFIGKSEYFAKGVKTAADFLMNLQLGGAYLNASNSNLLVRMPSVVIGCGLTAIDSAVEMFHYYPIQVEKFYKNWQKANNPEANLSPEDLFIAQEFISHAKLFQSANSVAKKLEIMHQLGGVTICYRKTIKESPAYLLNPEEIEHAMAIGVKFEESISPKSINSNKYGAAESITFCNNKTLQAKSILIAIGTENNEFQDIDGLDNYDSDIFKSTNNKISYFGDCNQKYAGNVVKALASAKNGYSEISKVLSDITPTKLQNFDKLKSYVHEVNILSDNIVELIIYSPLCAENFQPGQFFKLQNYSKDIKKIIEPIALTGSYVDKKSNLISLIVLEMGTSTNICRELKKGEEVVLMGPSGAPTQLFKNKNIALIGGGLGNAVLMAIAIALKANNCFVTYFAGYRKLQDRFYAERIEENSDQVIWACQEQEIKASRDTDLSIKGNIIDAIIYAKKAKFLKKTDHVICIGSDRMMEAVSARKKELFDNAEMVCSINSPMQCMMKGICGQCVQKVNDDRGYIFSCACQDQNSDIIDFNVLKNRLAQNSLLEKF